MSWVLIILSILATVLKRMEEGSWAAKQFDWFDFFNLL